MHDPRLLLQAAAVATIILALQPWTPARAYTETVLHSFSRGTDGDQAHGNLIMDQSGNLFGTTVYGGGACGKNSGCGTVFRLAPDGTETVLHAFSKPDGIFPYGGLVEDQSGNLYGTASEYGQLGRQCCGTIFEVTQQGVYTVLHHFAGVDGENPYAGLIADQQGNLYGTTEGGGTGGDGTVFERSQAGVYTVLFSFPGGAKGSNVFAPVVEDPAGNLYGTTDNGGKTRCGSAGGGTVFKLAPDGTQTVLYAFRGGRDGCVPGEPGLALDASGNLYGTTENGGGSGCRNNSGCGTVFEIAADGAETVLSRFTHTGTSALGGGVILDPAGNLFGTTSGGNSGGCGTVFEIVPGHSAKTLYSFTCGDDGGDPDAGLLMDQSGNLYGTTLQGGKAGAGVVFELEK
jgi:uncharacterized repeat protein (TIGR03803 family)